MAGFQDGLLTFARDGDSRWRVLLCLGLFFFGSASSDGLGNNKKHQYAAIVNITYKDPVTGEQNTEKHQMGRYGTTSAPRMEKGWVVHVRSADNTNEGCDNIVNVPKSGERWIALIKRGQCRFHQKISNAIAKNASAVVVYNHEDDDTLLTMEHNVGDHAVAVFISLNDGQRIARLVDNGTRVYMLITVGQHLSATFNHINKTSVLFVSISFIVLMIISLAWLVFYYIQRFRYAHAKERLSKRLMNAAKKAITKMPMRTIKNGDRETESDYDQCAVCIESYKSSDVIRILPCKHIFHKSCVDPWLIEQRSCPMCKLDILKAYGLQMHNSHESVANIELDVGSTSLGRVDMGLDPLASSSVMDEPTSSPHLETIRYQPAQVEHHQTPTDATLEQQQQAPPCSEDDTTSALSSTQNKLPVSSSVMAASDSLESIRSTESDSNELQSLMPRPPAKGNKPLMAPTNNHSPGDDVTGQHAS